MKLFKDQVVNLHKVEKVGIYMQTVFSSLIFFIVGYSLLFLEFEGRATHHSFMGIIFIIMSVFYLIIVYQALNGKGLNKDKL